ncbi:hypothetical protein VCCP104821_0611 [Vibrio cholerae CP1048(21)]|nr:hypothetical protein VCHC61A1_1485 [Vibrio cholerae HC-61A1]EJH36537.1 hypothetical protein VCCP103811_0679 [Vibrio cholerae CP1038(11)]EJH48279.1 hypothetical protein VCCP104821_0611 [Vibrio cholerae CP1048(21)]ELT26152.1 hypothetical protein VCHC7A1_01685 [Vibrio cholerae HC-7A1]CSD59951.1 Uncharacterised protein [Vibrio cholerae]
MAGKAIGLQIHSAWHTLTAEPILSPLSGIETISLIILLWDFA